MKYESAAHVGDYLKYWAPRLRKITNRCLDEAQHFVTIDGCAAIELGAGNGGTTAELLHRGAARVVAVEPAPLMNEQISASPLVEVIPEKVPLKGHRIDKHRNTYDLCVVHFALHAMTGDLPAVMRQARELLRPDGILVCAEWNWDDYEPSEFEVQLEDLLEPFHTACREPDHEEEVESQYQGDLLGLCTSAGFVSKRSDVIKQDCQWSRSSFVNWYSRRNICVERLIDARLACKDWIAEDGIIEVEETWDLFVGQRHQLPQGGTS